MNLPFPLFQLLLKIIYSVDDGPGFACDQAPVIGANFLLFEDGKMGAEEVIMGANLEI
jgi:hypothetical protein